MQSSGPIVPVLYSFMNIEPANPPTNPFPPSAPTDSAQTTIEQVKLQEMPRRLYPVV